MADSVMAEDSPAQSADLPSDMDTVDYRPKKSPKLLHVKEDDRPRSTASWYADYLGIDDDDFKRDVITKTNRGLLGRQEAEKETLADKMIERQGGSMEKALLHVIVSTDGANEPLVLTVVNTLLNRGAYASTIDNDKKTPLHYATERGFVDVVKELLQKGAKPHMRDSQHQMPLHHAVSESKDEIASLLLQAMPHKTVRELFTVPDRRNEDKEELSDSHGTESTDITEKAEFSLHDLINCGKMQQTVLAVLNCMMDPMGQSSTVRVHYHVLEADEMGRSPRHQQFNIDSRSCLHLMSKRKDKDLVYHDVVRLLLKRKWTGFARFSYLLNILYAVFFEAFLCIAAVLASGTDDPMDYTGGLQVFRAVSEFFCIGFVLFIFGLEVNQIRKHKLDHMKDVFNWLSLLSSLSLMVVLPLRLSGAKGQWQVYSIGFLLWNLRNFMFAYIFRTLGAYSQILGRIVRHDFPQFLWVFAIILVAFSGSFVLALRGEDLLHVHEETSTFWDSMFTGLRILIEAQPVVEYYGPDGYTGFLSCFLMVMFLGTCCVVLLNILIAQLSDTYHNVQSDAHRALELNRAYIITRTELHSLYSRRRKPHRITTYKPYEDIQNPKEVLKKWDNPPLSEINRHVRDIKDMHESHSVKLSNISKRMDHLEEQLKKIVELLSTRPEPGLESVERDNNPRVPYLSPVQEDGEEADGVGVSDSQISLHVKGLQQK